MKFAPTPWRNDNLKGWSPRRISAAKRALAKELARVEKERSKVALFPDLAADIVPDFSTVEERQQSMDLLELRITRTIRMRRAASWREARRLYFSFGPSRRDGIRRLWNLGIYPYDPAYFIEVVRKVTRPGCSPWTHLRKKRLTWLWAREIIARPAKNVRLAITRSFDTLGPVPSVRLHHQKLHRQRRHRLNVHTLH